MLVCKPGQERLCWVSRGASSEILAAHDTYCPDDNIRSDQRPVLAMFQLSADGERTSRQLLLARIQRMEEELRALKTLVEQMPE